MRYINEWTGIGVDNLHIGNRVRELMDFFGNLNRVRASTEEDKFESKTRTYHSWEFCLCSLKKPCLFLFLVLFHGYYAKITSQRAHSAPPSIRTLHLLSNCSHHPKTCLEVMLCRPPLTQRLGCIPIVTARLRCIYDRVNIYDSLLLVYGCPRIFPCWYLSAWCRHTDYYWALSARCFSNSQESSSPL